MSKALGAFEKAQLSNFRAGLCRNEEMWWNNEVQLETRLLGRRWAKTENYRQLKRRNLQKPEFETAAVERMAALPPVILRGH